jgi:hypothetical protein
MNDFSASFLSSNKLELLEFTKFIIPDIAIFNSGYDKNELMQICEKNSFPHPESADLDSVDLEIASNKVGFPSLIKPNITTGGRGITLVNSKEEFFAKYEFIKKEHGSCHLQQFISEGGKQFKVQLFIGNQGELLASSVIDKIRFYPEKGGSSCCNKTIEDESLVTLCYNVLKTIGWVGFADFDLIQDPKTGESKISDSVFYLGKRYGNEKHDVFLNADIFILPTLNETFGLVNLEAMMYGLPIITTDEGGIPDVVENNNTGFIIEKENSKLLVEKIEFLIKNESLRNELGQNGREKLLSKYTLAHFENNLSNILTSLS